MSISALVVVPSLFGISEAIGSTQSKARKKEHRSRDCNLVIRCSKSSKYSPEIHDRRVVLSGEKVACLSSHLDVLARTNKGYRSFIFTLESTTTNPSVIPSAVASTPTPARATKVSFPLSQTPIHNWIYVDRNTLEVKYGNLAASEGHYTGPFDCTRRLTYAGWEGFVAVKEGGFWALYFDHKGDLLSENITDDVPILEVELLRMELKERRKVKLPRSELEKGGEEEKESSG